MVRRTDLEAGHYLSTYFSGYATVRKYYDLRDSERMTSKDTSPQEKVAAKKEAASALIAIINSAGDSIKGGLLDPQVETVIPLDTLLALLGEALAFLNCEQLHLLTYTLLNFLTPNIQ